MGYPQTPGAIMRCSNELKVPHTTLRRWFMKTQNPPPNELVQEKKIDLVAHIRHELSAIFGEMEDARQDADYRALATAAGILLDKLQLLEGKPTAINEDRDWRDRAIDDIKAGRIKFEALAESFDESIATELFRSAGVPV